MNQYSIIPSQQKPNDGQALPFDWEASNRRREKLDGIGLRLQELQQRVSP